LLGAKRRDQLPEAGSAILLSLLLGDEVLTIHTTLLESLVAHEEETFFPPVLRAAWPTEGVSFHHRADVRVAAPDQTPLEAMLRVDQGEFPARVLNLTEAGVGVGLVDCGSLRLGMDATVETALARRWPASTLWGSPPHRAAGRGPAALASGLVLKGNGPAVLESLREFVQNRRTDRSEALRRGVQ